MLLIKAHSQDIINPYLIYSGNALNNNPPVINNPNGKFYYSPIRQNLVAQFTGEYEILLNRPLS